MKKYISSLKNMFVNDHTSLMYFVMGFLMFGASVVQIDDPVGKADPSLTHPYLTVYTCTITRTNNYFY